MHNVKLLIDIIHLSRYMHVHVMSNQLITEDDYDYDYDYTRIFFSIMIMIMIAIKSVIDCNRLRL